MTPEEVRHTAEEAMKRAKNDKVDDKKKEIAIDFYQSVIKCAYKAILFDSFFVGCADEEDE